MPKKELKSENSAGTALQEMEMLSPGGDLQAYINSVHSIGILTSEEEKKLAEDLYYRNDLDAARKLVLGSSEICNIHSEDLLRLWTI
jgi:DNA-directed RNA polymerase sigma subunit (sigma70/sigma32)